MPAGLQTWDANGNLKLDTDYNMGQIIYIFNTGVANGSVAVPNIGNGVPFIFVEENSADLSLVTLYSMPNVYISNGAVYWSFVDFNHPIGGAPVARRAVNVSVGIF